MKTLKKKSLVIREYKPKKEPVNVIFCGHVDAGKSTIGGQIMYIKDLINKIETIIKRLFFKGT